MNKVTRLKLDKQLDRLYGIIETLDPCEDNELYSKVEASIDKLTRLANQEDEYLESCQIEDKKRKSNFNAALTASGVSLLSWFGTWFMNDRMQSKAHDFESNYSYTSKFRSWLNKEPRH